jgi:hypothetical protein
MHRRVFHQRVHFGRGGLMHPTAKIHLPPAEFGPVSWLNRNRYLGETHFAQIARLTVQPHATAAIQEFKLHSNKGVYFNRPMSFVHVELCRN